MDEKEPQAIRERARRADKGAYSDYQVSNYYREDVPKLLDEVERLQKELDDAAKVADEWQDRGREYKKERDEWKVKYEVRERDCNYHKQAWEQANKERNEWKEKAERLEKENQFLIKQLANDHERYFELKKRTPKDDGIAKLGESE